MLGAIFPVALAGLRAICAQVCRSECTSAVERQLRTIVMRFSCDAIPGRRPCGKSKDFDSTLSALRASAQRRDGLPRALPGAMLYRATGAVAHTLLLQPELL